MEPLLRLSGLSVSYSGRSILDRIDLEIYPGEVIALTGPSGSGKTTLALAVLGVLPKTAHVEGGVSYRGTRIGPVFQEPSGALHPMLSVGRQVMEVARVRSGAGFRSLRSVAETALIEAGLIPERVFGAWPHQLSGGERQRVLIAQAIVGGPELLIADEPTASLDAQTRCGVLDTLKSLRTALLFITHSPGMLHGFSSRNLFLRDGRLHG